MRRFQARPALRHSLTAALTSEEAYNTTFLSLLHVY